MRTSGGLGVESAEAPGALARVLAPVSVEDFFARHFEELPLHVSRDDPEYFADVYGIADVERTILTGAREPDKFSLVKRDVNEVDPSQFVREARANRARATGKGPTTQLDPAKITAFFEAGFTLIVKDAGLFCPELQHFCTDLQHGLAAYAQANVYCTPPASQGFDVHHDTHDTLTIQCEGEKTWKIYEPIVRLPVESQVFTSGMQGGERILHREVTLRQGDTLYIPRGFPHEAATSDSRSLHVTFALAPIRVVDVMDALARLACEGEIDLRRAYRPGEIDAPDFAERFARTIQAAIARTCTPQSIALARELAVTELFELARPEAGGAFDQAQRLAALSDADLLVFDRSKPCDVRVRGNSIAVLFPGKALGFPVFCTRAIEQLQAGPIAYAELDSALSPHNRQLLVRTLVLEGIVRIVSQEDVP